MLTDTGRERPGRASRRTRPTGAPHHPSLSRREGPGRRAPGTLHLLTVDETRARLTRARSAPRVGPPAASTASCTREPTGRRCTPGRRTSPTTCTTTTPEGRPGRRRPAEARRPPPRRLRQHLPAPGGPASSAPRRGPLLHSRPVGPAREPPPGARTVPSPADRAHGRRSPNTATARSTRRPRRAPPRARGASARRRARSAAVPTPGHGATRACRPPSRASPRALVRQPPRGRRARRSLVERVATARVDPVLRTPSSAKASGSRSRAVGTNPTRGDLRRARARGEMDLGRVATRHTTTL